MMFVFVVLPLVARILIDSFFVAVFQPLSGDVIGQVVEYLFHREFLEFCARAAIFGGVVGSFISLYAYWRSGK